MLFVPFSELKKPEKIRNLTFNFGEIVHLKNLLYTKLHFTKETNESNCNESESWQLKTNNFFHRVLLLIENGLYVKNTNGISARITRVPEQYYPWTKYKYKWGEDTINVLLIRWTVPFKDGSYRKKRIRFKYPLRHPDFNYL